MGAPEKDDGNRLCSGCLLGFWGVSCELSNMAMLCQRLGKLAPHLAPTEAWWNSCGGVFEGFARGQTNKCPLVVWIFLDCTKGGWNGNHLFEDWFINQEGSL